MLKQKIAGVMIFHPLRLRLMADMSNNIVCFSIAWPCFKMLDFLTVFSSRIPSFSFFIFYSHRRFQHFFFFFFSFNSSVLGHRIFNLNLYLNINQFRLKDDLKTRRQGKTSLCEISACDSKRLFMLAKNCF